MIENMKLVMINDCAGVGETLLRYIPDNIEKQHVKRTRKLWSKTFGIAYQILRAKGDVYHSNFLLQDCYVALRFGKKPIVGWGLGSDIRRDVHHPLWGKIVRHNLKNCNRILVSTPDILEPARIYRKDAEYFPPAVDTCFYHVKTQAEHEGKKNVLIGSNVNWYVKGIDTAIRALSKNSDQVNVSIIQYGSDFEKTMSLASSLHLPIRALPVASHEQMRKYYWDSDVVVDQFRCGCAGMVSLEAIACGRPAVTYIASEFEGYEDFPLKDLKTEDQIADAILGADKNFWKKEYEYLIKNHEPITAAKKILSIYNSLIEEG
jgi:glycosyltransferase involved in cell wall biosynthesis